MHPLQKMTHSCPKYGAEMFFGLDTKVLANIFLMGNGLLRDPKFIMSPKVVFRKILGPVRQQLL